MKPKLNYSNARSPGGARVTLFGITEVGIYVPVGWWPVTGMPDIDTERRRIVRAVMDALEGVFEMPQDAAMDFLEQNGMGPELAGMTMDMLQEMLRDDFDIMDDFRTWDGQQFV